MASATVLTRTPHRNLPADDLSKTVLKDRVARILDEFRRGLAIAVTIPQVKLVADIAAAQEIFSARQQLSEDVIGRAHELKIEALARLGVLIERAPKATGTRGQLKGRTSSGGSRRDPPEETTPTLAEQGVDKKTVNLARKLAALTDTERNAVASRDKTLGGGLGQGQAQHGPLQLGPPRISRVYPGFPTLKL